MLRRLSIATRLGLAACLFLIPIGYGLWTQNEAKSVQIAQSRWEVDGASYLRGIDAVHAAIARALVLRQPMDSGGLAQTLAELRERYGGLFGTDDLSLELEALVRAKDRSPTKIEARRTLRKLTQQVANRSGIPLDPEMASFYLGDIFVLRLADLRELLVELRGGDSPGDVGNSTGAALFNGRIESLLQEIEEAVNSATGPQGYPAMTETLNETFQPFGLMMGHTMTMLDNGATNPGLLAGTFDAIDHFARAANGQFVDLVEARINRLNRERLRSATIAGALSLLAFAVVVAIVRMGVIGPLRRMTDALGRLADGDVTVSVPETRFDDEVADLGQAMQRFKKALEDTRSLSDTVVQATLQVSVATGQAAVAIAQVSDGAHGQMASVERLRRSFLETREAMTAVAAVSRTGQERSRDSADRLAAGLADVGAMAEAVREIAEMSNEINRVTVAISKLAAHSNILSLNASIEASRAGEHGRGFSVVAGAVGTLAQQTLGLAQEIAALARRSHERIARGLEVAASVGDRMQEVSATMAETDRLSQTIVDEVERQRQSVDAIEEALMELSHISHANASASEQIAATMRGLAALTDDTRRRAEQVVRTEG
ncbi:methyl-accepting chemotaxis protein [Azospirillum griseum]|uniref:Methyl-accepting chemotaxis protein n=1 Tax=Azospirillum griseum TaxID=2496639 RepID=A0A431VCD4_9PROT|nr:methyl-accepting chemotaxis protein [Azospirillum griseum]RTR16281.1 methyl-accepting chemotaxis protein [Azospirillum griseum]